VLGFVRRNVEVQDEHHAPRADKRADNQDEAEQLDKETQSSDCPDGAEVEVHLQVVDKDQGRERMEKPELARLEEGQARVQVRNPGSGEIVEEQNDEEALGVEPKDCFEPGSIDARHGQTGEE